VTRRRALVASARAFNALFFFSVSAYGVLAYSPFTYGQFIKPDIIPAIADFVTLSPALFWLALLVTVLTLLPHLQPPARSRAAVAYVLLWGAVGVWVLLRPILATLADSPRSLIVSLLALAAPVSLAVVDHVLLAPPAVAPVDQRRAVVSVLRAGFFAWAVFAIAVPVRLRQAVGITLSGREMAIALGGSAVAVVAVFAAALVIALTILALARLAGSSGTTEYWLLIAMLAAAFGAVLYGLVWASIAFSGRMAAFVSAVMGAAVAAVWADMARLRAAPPDASVTAAAIDALGLFVCPIVGRQLPSRRALAAWLMAVPILAFVLVSAVVHLDWNFLLQKLAVLVVWLAALAVVHAATRGGQHRARRRGVLAPAIALAACAVISLALSRTQPLAGRGVDVESALDRYAAVDPAYRLIRDARRVPSGETAKFYGYLHENTLVPPASARPADIDFVAPLHAAPGPKPPIFLFIIDSLRRDYLSPYNPRVTFTPAIAQFASDSVVFDRAFTRYAGTALAVPAMWAGGMLIHELEQHDFGRRNALLKLLDADGYHQVLTMDHIVKELMPVRTNVTELDPTLPDIERDMCRTVGEIDPMLTEHRDPRPMFFYTLPQNVHIAVASKRKVPPGETYPGFFAPVASSVRYVDGCFAGFVAALKQAGLYDRSIVIVTSDHGDSLGEGGRWGHAFFLEPEVMRVPLIIHLPSDLRARVAADTKAVAFATDITPTLYALLGHDPSDLGPLFGRPLFGPIDGPPPAPRPEPFLLGSSYGAVYGILRDNGRLLYTSDAEDARDFAFDLHGSGPGVPLALTADMTAENRRLIAGQLAGLAALNHLKR
jgi:hypothetical protein